jgi:predicted MFS family arabinose efflux permease
MGLTQGLLATLVADVAPAGLRGTAFGAFNMAQGVALLVGNMAGGVLWTAAGPGATFGASAALTAIALLGLARHARGPRGT